MATVLASHLRREGGSTNILHREVEPNETEEIRHRRQHGC